MQTVLVTASAGRVVAWDVFSRTNGERRSHSTNSSAHSTNSMAMTFDTASAPTARSRITARDPTARMDPHRYARHRRPRVPGRRRQPHRRRARTSTARRTTWPPAHDARRAGIDPSRVHARDRSKPVDAAPVRAAISHMARAIAQRETAHRHSPDRHRASTHVDAQRGAKPALDPPGRRRVEYRVHVGPRTQLDAC